MTGVSGEVNAIEIRNLKRSYGNKPALNGLSMTVPAGAIYGLIGENGCGKSTTQKAVSRPAESDGSASGWKSTTRH